MNLYKQITDKSAFYLFALLSFVSVISAIVLNNFALLLLPPALIFGLIAILDYKLIFYFFFLILPFSIEIYLPNGLGTDLPTEPVMLFLTALFFLLFLWKGKEIDIKQLLVNPVSKIVLFHLLWIGITAVMSDMKLISIKYFLAKLWYVIPFYFLPLILFNSTQGFVIALRVLVLSVCLSCIYVMVRHAGLSFAFDEINEACKPIYRNHVNYGAIIVACLPFAWALFKTQPKKVFYFGLITLLLVATYLTYTRAAYVVVILSVVLYWVIQFKVVKHAAAISFVLVALLLNNFLDNNKYLGLAPNYERTVAHTKFDNLLEATYQFEDISTMERLYRWVAGFNMLNEKPIFGNGPSTFYSKYESYTVSSFQTYVSDNPEKSGIHNNYLMVAVEQGYIGLVIMLLVILIPLILGEKCYHAIKDSDDKHWLMAAILSVFSTAVIILINDLLESDKVGTIFFLSLSIISICCSLYLKKEQHIESVNS